MPHPRQSPSSPILGSHIFGKKIKVPFEQLIIFSTNLEPADLVDEAFLRRIPYKVEIRNPELDEFHYLFELQASAFTAFFESCPVLRAPDDTTRESRLKLCALTATFGFP